MGMVLGWMELVGVVGGSGMVLGDVVNYYCRVAPWVYDDRSTQYWEQCV